jgi:hypothetical protein
MNVIAEALGRVAVRSQVAQAFPLRLGMAI